MSMITFSENHESSLIAFEAGRALANFTNPQAEALKWSYSLGSIPTSHVVIVGLGAGFHVAALADLDPHLKITVVDHRPGLLPVFNSQFSELSERVEVVIFQNAEDLFKTDLFQEVLNQRCFVLSFQECWGESSTIFANAFAHLTGRSVESVKSHFEDFGINIKAFCMQNKNMLSIKDVLPAVESSNATEKEKNAFRTLGELVK